jgi:hypothetical protein
MRTPPAEVVLAWPNPNYTDPVTRGNTLVVVNVILFSFAVLLVAARLYTRLCVKMWAGLDDVFIFLALVSPLPPPFSLDMAYRPADDGNGRFSLVA